MSITGNEMCMKIIYNTPSNKLLVISPDEVLNQGQHFLNYIFINFFVKYFQTLLFIVKVNFYI